MQAPVRPEDAPPTGERPSASPPPSDARPPPSGGTVWRLGGVLRTLRPHQWIKNVFVLAPLLFAKEIFDPLLLFRATGAFGVFCLLAGAVYTMNDIADADADRLHPVKRYRPIAAERVPVPMAKAIAVALVACALFGAALGPPRFAIVALGYFALNVAYSLRLKKIAYLDVGCIAAGFVLRVVGGGYATYIHVSGYLLACTALLALFLGFGKRRHELAAAAVNASRQRVALEAYTPRGLDLALGLTSVATVGTYLAYTLDSHTRELFKSNWLWPSTVLVVLAMLRFLQLVRTRPKAESPTQEMLKDGPFVATLLLWAFLVMLVVYNLRPG